MVVTVEPGVVTVVVSEEVTVVPGPATVTVCTLPALVYVIVEVRMHPASQVMPPELWRFSRST